MHQVLVNLVRSFNITQTYVDKDDPCLGILASEAFTIRWTKNRSKGHSPGQLVFVRDMILPIKNKMEWELICQKKQTQINKNNIRENIKWGDHDYKFRDKFILTDNTA